MFKCRSFSVHLLKNACGSASQLGRAGGLWCEKTLKEKRRFKEQDETNEENEKRAERSVCVRVFCCFFFCLVSAASVSQNPGKKTRRLCDEAQMKRWVRKLKRKDVRCCSHQIKLNTTFPPSTPAYFLSSSVSLSLSLLPSPASSLHFSFFISPGLSVPGQKDPATVFKDRAPGREVDVVAKVMTTAIRSTHKHKCIQMAHTRIYIHKHVHLCCQHFRPCMRLSDMLFEDIGEAVWATCFTPGATSNEIPAWRLQVWHL